MCSREHGSLQRGMYFRQPPGVSVVLMSRRPGAPYVDTLSEGGTELEYEGHDARREGKMDPKEADQPRTLPNGSPSENGLFAEAASKYANRESPAALVRVYEKLPPGIWSDKGLFELIGQKYEAVAGRRVFRFRMRLTDESSVAAPLRVADAPRSRIIPSHLKQAVFKRDKGKCVLCGASDQLHFDHDLPYSRGGTSVIVENVRLLCARHNLQKAARIE
jgi:hypothetical protein